MELRRHPHPRTFVRLVVVIALSTVAFGQDQPRVPYPDGFRSWTHVKSDYVGPGHSSFAKRGGFHHFYANAPAIQGYRTGKFPNGSVLVDEGVLAKEGDDKAKGMLLEGERRAIDVMVKDDTLYTSTGGWGYEHFDGNERTGKLTTSERTRCFECHGTQEERDSVFTTIRP